jgi:hypothetical protein
LAADLPDSYRLLRVAVSDEVFVAELDESALPDDWRENVTLTQAAGSEWLETGNTPLLKVRAW